MSTLNQESLVIIKALFVEAEAKGILLWLESGWAIDARLKRITREHEDIDIAFPYHQEPEYIGILKNLGFGTFEKMDYGFLMRKGQLLIDSEPCFKQDQNYVFPNFPPGSCPLEKEGELDGFPLRCISWEAMYVEFLGYMQEVPSAQWRPKDFVSLEMIKQHLTASQMQDLQLFGR